MNEDNDPIRDAIDAAWHDLQMTESELLARDPDYTKWLESMNRKENDDEISRKTDR